MIDIAYNKIWLYNLEVVRTTKQWYKQNVIAEEQFLKIVSEYPSSLYSPNLIIRIILFIASLLVLLGITGLLTIAVIDSIEEKVVGIASIIYGAASFFILDLIFIKSNRHYKSGVTEALLYHSIGFTILGFVLLTDGNEYACLFVAIVLFTFAAVRYLDLVSTICALLSFSWLLFIELYNLDGMFRQIIPFVFILIFFVIYRITKKFESHKDLTFWKHNLLIIKVFSLIMVYVAGNYFVVRELSISMMDIEIEVGADIPFSFVFYILTVLIPLAYLYFGIAKKDIVLLRISLLLVAFSAFTFKYYFSFGHPEITLTIAGSIVLSIAIALLNYLKMMKHGYTRENVLSEKWSSLNVEAFIISQTMGGNQTDIQQQSETGGGGGFGGGGSTERF